MVLGFFSRFHSGTSLLYPSLGNAVRRNKKHFMDFFVLLEHFANMFEVSFR